MRELRIQHEGRPYRVLYAFDPRRSAIRLFGADKTRTAGMRKASPAPMRFMTNIWHNWKRTESTMAKKFSELRAQMSPEAQVRSDVKASQMIAEMALGELRRARGLSQEALAAMLHVKQPSIAKLEQRTDMYISTLRTHIKAMGGELEIIARFPDGDVKIVNFSALDEPVD
jgi:DNA-binding transcriptional regulator YiaG